MLKRIILIYFIFIFHQGFTQSPANINYGLKWWFKANDGLNVDTLLKQVNSWNNFALKSTVNNIERVDFSTNGFPKLSKNSFNFNTGIKFRNDSISCFRTKQSDIKNLFPNSKNSTTIVVFKSKQKAASPSSLHYYSPTIYTTESAYTTLDYSLGFADGKVVLKCDSIDYWTVNTTQNYNDNKSKIAVASRVILDSKNENSFISLIVNGKLDINKTVVNQSFVLNGNNIEYPNTFYGITVGGVVEPSSKFIYPQTGFDGEIAEIIVYDTIIGNYPLQKVNSYLAIKYGITLNQNSKYNYFSSNDSIIWDATKAGIYNKNIAGIGQDNASSLYQLKSKSDNDNSYLTIGSPSDLQNLEFLTWSDNGAIFEAVKDSIVDIFPPIERRVQKMWKIQKRGIVGNVGIEFDISNIPGNKSAEDIVLVIDSNDIVNDGYYKILNVSDFKNNIIYFDKVDLMDKSINYFTLATLNRTRTPLSEKIIESPQIVIYQLISPNNDQINDNFKILNVEYIPQNELYIYNHEGNLIYNKKDFKNGDWDCSQVIDGHYFYILKTEKQKYSGTLLIQRQ